VSARPVLTNVRLFATVAAIYSTDGIPSVTGSATKKVVGVFLCFCVFVVMRWDLLRPLLLLLLLPMLRQGPSQRLHLIHLIHARN